VVKGVLLGTRLKIVRVVERVTVVKSDPETSSTLFLCGSSDRY